MTGSGLFEGGFDYGLIVWGEEVRESVEAAEGKEVEGFGLVEASQAVGHGEIVTREFGVATHSSR